MAEHKRFYVVVQAGEPNPVARVFDDIVEAEKAAQSLAVAHQGETFVIFKPEEAYRSTVPRAEKVYLAWRAEAEPAQPPPEPDALSLATSGAL